MYGGVRVTKQNNIFNLIENADATLDDLKKLIDIAPKKLNDKKENLNPLDWAIRLRRNDMINFLRTKGLEQRNDAQEKLYSDIRNNIVNSESVSKLVDIIENKNLSLLPQDKQYYIYRLLDNYHYAKDEKINELIERKLFDNINEKNSLQILYDNMNENILLFKIGLKNGARSKIILFDVNILGYAIKYCTRQDALERIKLLINAGADVKYEENGITYFNYLIEAKKSVEFYKVFIDAGLYIDTEVSSIGFTLLFLAIGKNNKELFLYLIENGADVNKEIEGDKTALMMACSVQKDIYYVKKLIEHGAQVNAVSQENTNALMLSINFADDEKDLEIIKYLLDHGADKTIKSTTRKPSSAIDLAYDGYEENPELFKKILLLLGEEVKEVLWKGSTRSDIEKYDIFFERPYDYSCCPICLDYIERKEGCMYMSHDCASRKHYYHNKLYNTYAYSLVEGAPKKVEWCTVCGRITKNHKHYQLSFAKNPSKTLEVLDPEIQARLNANENIVFFDNANCIGFGGGGTLEKAARFRRLREYTLELQEDVDKKKHNDAMNELIEEIFNAPLVRNRKINKILEDKKWNINIKDFPENVRNTRNNNANRNYANIPFEGMLPTLLPSKDHDCIIFGDDNEGKEDNPIIHFHHQTRGGINHDGIDICQKDLARAIEVANKEFGDERFGKCWFSTCQAIMHPEEIKNHVPEVLYLDYKKKFNKKMAREGGNRYTQHTRKNTKKYSKNQSILHKLDLSEVTCALPNFKKDGTLRRSK